MLFDTTLFLLLFFFAGVLAITAGRVVRERRRRAEAKLGHPLRVRVYLDRAGNSALSGMWSAGWV